MRRTAILAGAVVLGACSHPTPETAPAPATPAPAAASTAADDAARAERERLAAAARDAAAKAHADSVARQQALDAERSRLAETIYFEFDSDQLSDATVAKLQEKLPVMVANPTVKLRIEGNADERGSDEYNLALGDRRAGAVRRWFAEHGVSSDRLAIVSNGEEHPVCREHDDSCYQKNRRDEFAIVAGNVDALPNH